MGLLDSLTSGSQGGYGGLLDMLMYRSPINQPQSAQQPEYDAMGNFTGIVPQASADPFGLPPNFNPSLYAPPSPFNNGSAPVAGLTRGLPALPSSNIPSPPQVAANLDAPQNPIDVGGYQMPRVGNLAEFTPRTPTEFSAQSRLQPQDQGQTSPTFVGGQSDAGLGDKLNASLQNFANADGVLPALAGGISGLLTGNRTDKAGVAQQNLKAQYDSLVPMLGPQKAMLAVMNPEAGKILLAQALEKKQYSFTKLDNDTIVANDPLSGKSSVSYGGGEANKAGVAGPDGKIIPFPEGLDAAGRKTFANEIAKINADAAGGKKTEVQAKSEKFANKMENAEKNIRGLEGELQSYTGRGLEAGGIAGNAFQSEKYQRAKQARDNFITALLRDESGAAIGTQEFQRYERELFPQPGDAASVVAQKAEARRIAINSMKSSAGPGYKPPSEATTSAPAYSDGTTATNPKTGQTLTYRNGKWQ